MATTTYLRGAETGIASTISGLVFRIAENYRKRREFRTALHELQMLSNRELADIGIHRSQIRGIARNAVYGDEA